MGSALRRPRSAVDGDYAAAPSTPRAVDPQASPLGEQPNPLASASLVSLAMIHWIQPLMSLGARQIVEREDIWPVCAADACDQLEARFRREYSPKADATPFRLSPLAWAFVKTFRHELAVIFANMFLSIGALAFQAYVAQAMLQFLNDRENLLGVRSGYVLWLFMAVASFLSATCLNYGFFLTSRVGVNMRSLTMDLVYQKSLRLSSTARQQYTTGEVLTLMSVDAERVFNTMMQGPWLVFGFFAFVTTIVVLAFLFNVYAALAAAAVLALLLLVSARQGEQIAAAQRRLLEVVDERVKVTSEVLQGIRVMKFYAWEESAARRVEAIREREVRFLRKFHYLQIANTAMLFLTPAFLAGVSLGVYVLVHGTISVIDAFTMVAMVNISRSAATALPQAVSALSQGKVAYSRLDAFLASDEFQVERLVDGVVQAQLEPGSISIRDGHFAWPLPEQTTEMVVVINDESTPSPMPSTEEKRSRLLSTATDISERGHAAFRLSNINLEVHPGELVMIVGTVGSGKSSLLNGLLGEMQLVSGHMDISGRLAYVSQEAWIRNLSLRENILFDAELDADRYERVLEATQLSLDLKALPNGDETEIGERGINLSGGQKARVAIARAMYSRDYDILILDDPLSAVDPHVAHAIFRRCIVGLAADKTRLLVLNSHYDLLDYADRVVVVDSGRIVGDGTFEEIARHFPDLRTQQQTLVDDPTVNIRDAITEDVEEIGLETESGVVEPEEDADEGQAEEGKGRDGARLVQDEDRVRGRVSGKTYRTYLDETGLNGVAVLLILLMAYAVSQGIRVVADWWPSHWAKNMATRYGVDPEYSGTRFGMVYLAIIVVCAVTTLGRALLLVELAVRSSSNLHNELFRRVLRAPITLYFDVTPIGRILNRFSNDLDQVDAVLPQQFQLLLQNASVCLGSLVVAAFASYWIAVSYVPVAVIFVLVGLYFKKTSAEVKRLEDITRSPVYNLFSETLAGLGTIRAFQRQEQFVRTNKQLVDANTALYLTYWSVGRWLAVRLDLLSVLVIAVVSLYLVATKGLLGVTVSGLALTYSLMLASQVQWVMRAVDRADNAMTSVERLLHFRSIASESDGDGNSVDNWSPARGEIEFDELCLRYRPELPLVLRGVSMRVAAGEKVGICGRTGAGKSSLMTALFRVCSFDSGRVLIDGVDIQRLKLRELRRGLAIIPQDPVLYSGTLRDNVDPFREYSDEAIWAALRHVHLADLVADKRGRGLAFRVSEGGENLSVGQRQLLCISRALLKGSRIVVLDEATASVDSATDALIQATIREAFADKTVLTIAHRIDTIMHCDKIVVMAAGRVAELASPAELLDRPDSIFASLVKRSVTK